MTHKNIKQSTVHLEPAKMFSYEIIRFDLYDSFLNSFQRHFQHDVNLLSKRAKYEFNKLYHLMENWLITNSSTSNIQVSFDDIVESCCLICLLEDFPCAQHTQPNEYRDFVIDKLSGVIDDINEEIDIRPTDVPPNCYEYLVVTKSRFTILVECIGDVRILKYHGVVDENNKYREQ